MEKQLKGDTMKKPVRKSMGASLCLTLGLTLTLLVVSGCAKEECYECVPYGNIPGQETVQVCGKGSDKDVSLAWYRNRGYTCSKVSASSRITSPDDQHELQTRNLEQ